eukprot:s5720_g2.t1
MPSLNVKELSACTPAVWSKCRKKLKAKLEEKKSSASLDWLPKEAKLADVQWSHDFRLESRGGETRTARAFHFDQIFGKLAHPYAWKGKAKGRGPLGVHVQVHPDDFRGPRSDLRFYIYDLPGAANREILDPHLQLWGLRG